MQRCVELEGYQEEVDRNLETKQGKELMQVRQVYSEGFFGDMKMNWKADRLRRRGESGVKVEIYAYALGKNMRRFHKLYWQAVERKENLQEKADSLIAFVRQNMANTCHA